MDDLISRQAAINHIKAQRERFFTGCTIEEGMEMLIREVPSADVVEVVRCKDCTKCEYCRTTNVWAVPPEDDWFCADGERRTDGEIH